MAALELENIARRKDERRRLLRSSLRRMLPQLVKIGAVKVILFGSLADNTVSSGSDLDILVVMPKDRSGKEWSRIIYKEIDRDIAADILVFNTEELEAEIPANRFLQQIMEKGRLVFEKDS